MNAIKNIIERASKLNGTVVLPEGQDARVITAACACVERKIATPIVLGTAAEIADAEAKAGKKLSDFGIAVIDYTTGLVISGEAESFPLQNKEGSSSSRSGKDSASPLVGDSPLRAPVSRFMTAKPSFVYSDAYAVDLLKIFERKRIDDLPVCDRKGKVVGLVDLQDLPKMKVL